MVVRKSSAIRSILLPTSISIVETRSIPCRDLMHSAPRLIHFAPDVVHSETRP
jgi:hypothetical protein